MSDPHPRPRPAQLRPLNLGLVFIGGMLGVLAREALLILVPTVAGLPLAVLLTNLIGAFALGVLLAALERLARRAPQRRNSWHRIRLLLGTGLLGGFTTYSALAQGVLLLWTGGAVWLALGYGFGTVLLGGVATWCGILLGNRIATGSAAVATAVDPAAQPPRKRFASRTGGDCD